MGLQITWTPDDTTISKQLVLCNSSRSIAEHNVKLNHRSLVEPSESYRAPNTTQYDRYNNRNTFSFEVQRDTDFSGAAFPDPEAAFLFAAMHCGDDMIATSVAIHGTGDLVAVLSGSSTNKTLTFNNCACETIELVEWLGLSVTFRYTFQCGLITSS